MRTTVFRLCGQCSIGPTGVCDQSRARMRAPISPPPKRNEVAPSRDLLRSSFITLPRCPNVIEW